jgi:carboxymethylenebutenolidase
MNKKIITILIVVVAAGAIYWFGNQPSTESAMVNLNTDEESVDENVLADSIVGETKSEAVAYHGDTEGYLAQPLGEGPFPALILIHEWWGLNQNIKDLADDFAEQGYVALAVDLYDGVSADSSDKAGELAGMVRENTSAAFENLTAATSYLQTLPEVDGEKLASVGWCFGGQWAYNMAANNMGVDASVMYYGRFSMEDDLSMMRADILGHFGEEDRSIAIDDVREFEAKLQTLEGEHSVFIYPNAGHAFANEDNEDAYNDEAAQLAWQRTMDFLSRELK